MRWDWDIESYFRSVRAFYRRGLTANSVDPCSQMLNANVGVAGVNRKLSRENVALPQLRE